MKWLRALLLCLSLLLLACAEFILVSELWLGIEPGSFTFLQPWNCVLSIVCQLRYPRYFGVALIAIVVALALFHFAVRRSPLSQIGRGERGEGELTAMPLPLNFTSSAWANRFRLALVLAVLVSIILAYQSVMPPGHPQPVLWLAALTLVGFMFYCADRAAQRGSLFTGKELFWLVGFVALLLALAAAYRSELTRLIAIGIVLAVALWLWVSRKVSREVIAFAVVVTLAFAVYSFDLMSWRYSFIGDEYAFYDYANNIAKGINRPYLLSPVGVYDAHPVLASYLQSATIVLYGNDIYGWRISDTLVVVLAALPLYVFVRTFATARSAFVALTVYLSSQHLLGLSKIGYNHSQMLVPVLTSMAFFALAAKRGSLLGIFLSGLASAFAFYTFTLGIPFIALPVLFLALFYVRAGAKHASPLSSLMLSTAALVLGIGLTALPSLSGAQAFVVVAGHTIANTEVRTGNALTEQVLPNFVYALSAPLAFQGHSHYVSGAHADPLSAVLVLLGVGGLLVAVTRSRLALWLLLSFVLAAFFVGGFAPYAYPPVTRTFSLIPFYSIFATIGASRLLAGLAQFAPPRRTLTVVWLLILMVIPALNLYQFFNLTDRVNPQENLAIVVKEFQEQPAISSFYLVVPTPSDYYGVYQVLRAYNLDANKVVIISDGNSEVSLPAIRRSARDIYEILVAWNLPTRDRWRTAMQELWPAQTEVELRDGTDRPHFAKLIVDTHASDVAVHATGRPGSVPASPLVAAPVPLRRIVGTWTVAHPRDIAIGADGLAYTINGTKRSIEVFSLDGKLQRTLPGDWKEPVALAFNSRQELLVLDSGSRYAVTRVRTDGTLISRSSSELGVSSGRGLALGDNDEVYIADTGGSRILRLNRELLEPQRIMTSVTLEQPTSLTVVGDKLVVADAPKLYVLSPTGEVVAQWNITPYNDIQPPRFLPNQKDLIVMTNPEPGDVLLFDLQGHVLQTIGPPNYERMHKPIGIAATSDGRVFVAENEGDQIRIFDWGAP